MPLSAKDWTLAVLAEAGRPMTPVQLQKALFLLGHELASSFYEFEPYNYGPFCREVYLDAERLAGEQLALISRDGRLRTYAATLGARVRVAQLGLNEKQAQAVRSVVALVMSMGFGELVRHVYKHHPGMRENSVFQG